MAGKTLTHALLRKALDMHVTSTGQTISEGEDLGEKRFLLSPGDIKCSVKDGRLICSSQSVFDQLIEILMFMDDEPQASQSEDKADAAMMSPVKPPKSGLVSQAEMQKIAELKGQKKPESSVDAWRAGQARDYNVQGKKVPNAFGASEQANRRGINTEIIDSGRTKDLVWGHVRVTDPATGQYREDRVSHERETFCLLKSWEDANAQARYQKPGQPPLILGVLDNNMPEMNPEVKIKGMPAPLWLTMQVMRAWSFADRDAITKAERRAQLKILNREWREKEEIRLEEEEEQAVQDMRARA